jgi:hypothetical protein
VAETQISTAATADRSAAAADDQTDQIVVKAEEVRQWALLTYILDWVR